MPWEEIARSADIVSFVSLGVSLWLLFGVRRIRAKLDFRYRAPEIVGRYKEIAGGLDAAANWSQCREHLKRLKGDLKRRLSGLAGQEKAQAKNLIRKLDQMIERGTQIDLSPANYENSVIDLYEDLIVLIEGIEDNADLKRAGEPHD